MNAETATRYETGSTPSASARILFQLFARANCSYHSDTRRAAGRSELMHLTMYLRTTPPSKQHPAAVSYPFHYLDFFPGFRRFWTPKDAAASAPACIVQ